MGNFPYVKYPEGNFYGIEWIYKVNMVILCDKKTLEKWGWVFLT